MNITNSQEFVATLTSVETKKRHSGTVINTDAPVNRGWSGKDPEPLSIQKPQPAIKGTPYWFSSDQTIARVKQAPDGLSALVSAVGPTGTAKVVVTGEADLETGRTFIFGTMDVSVSSGQAVELKVSLGGATEQKGGVQNESDRYRSDSTSPGEHAGIASPRDSPDQINQPVPEPPRDSSDSLRENFKES